jgi:hypothetical protein
MFYHGGTPPVSTATMSPSRATRELIIVNKDYEELQCLTDVEKRGCKSGSDDGRQLSAGVALAVGLRHNTHPKWCS